MRLFSIFLFGVKEKIKVCMRLFLKKNRKKIFLCYECVTGCATSQKNFFRWHIAKGNCFDALIMISSLKMRKKGCSFNIAW